MGSNKIKDLDAPSSPNDGVNKAYADNTFFDRSYILSNYYDKTETDSNFLKLNGNNTMAGDLHMGSNKITNLSNPTNQSDGVNLSHLQSNYDTTTTADLRYLKTLGDNSMSGDLNVGFNKVINCNDPVNNKDAVNLQYFNNNIHNNVITKKKIWGDKTGFNGANDFNAEITVSANSNQAAGVSFTLNSSQPHCVHAFAQIWTYDPNDPITDTDIILRFVGDFPDSGKPTDFRNYPRNFPDVELPNIPGDRTCLYFDHTEYFKTLKSVDVELFIKNKSNSQNKYSVIIKGDVQQINSLSNL
jgi:hypothetical protein